GRGTGERITRPRRRVPAPPAGARPRRRPRGRDRPVGPGVPVPARAVAGAAPRPVAGPRRRAGAVGPRRGGRSGAGARGGGAGGAPSAVIAEAVHGPVELLNSEQQAAPLALLAGRPVAAFCGLGNPEAFRRTLLGLGAAVGAFRTFPDHHAYGREDVDALRD